MGRSERNRAKATANGWFSKYIRLRDCISSTRGVEYGRCVTCGDLKEFKALDCGHFVPGRTDALLYDEHNARAQCQACNRFRQGQWVEFERALLDRYGLQEVTRLKRLKYSPVQYSVPELRAIADKYREKYKTLLEDNK